jgi:8-oxo-dGTP diphosphatase
MRIYGKKRTDKYYKDRPGAYGIILRNQDMLITEESAMETELQLPGGGIDPGESPAQALVREAREETGWLIQPLQRLGAYQRFCFMPDYDLWARKICHIYLCKAIRHRSPPTELHHTAIWTTPFVAAKVLSVQADREFVQKAFGL